MFRSMELLVCTVLMTPWRAEQIQASNRNENDSHLQLSPAT